MQLSLLIAVASGACLLILAFLVGVCLLQPPCMAEETRPAPTRVSAARIVLLQRISLVVGVLLATLLLSAPEAPPPGMARVAHRCALVVLGTFLLAALYLQIRTVVAFHRSESVTRLARDYERLWQITEVAPAPTALVLLASGVRMTTDHGHSLREGWLLVLTVAFGILFFDGILGFTPLVRDLHRRARDTVEMREVGRLRERSLSIAANATLLLHFSSFPFLVLMGWFRPAIPNPFAGLVGGVEQWAVAATSRGVGPQTAILVVLGLTGLFVGALRRLTSARTALEEPSSWKVSGC